MLFLRYFLFLLLICATGTAHAANHTFEITWAIDDSGFTITEYRLYAATDTELENVLCTAEGNTTTMQCSVVVDDEATEASYILTSYSADAGESLPSEPFTVIFSQTTALQATARITVQEGSRTITADASTSTGTITGYSWNFGDGTLIDTTDPIISHTYSADAVYMVTLTIHDSSGETAATQQEITINTDGTNHPPVAQLVLLSSPTGNSPLLASFDASHSTDPDGDPLIYSWNFGDGIQMTGGAQISHQYAEPGIYTASVTVTDNKGGTDSINSQPIIVLASADGDTLLNPQAVIRVDTTISQPSATINFSGSSSVTLSSDTKIIRYSWNFGDGSTGEGENVSHVFKQEGAYLVQLVVTDSNGHQGMASTTVYISNTVDIKSRAALLIQMYKLLLLNK